MKNSKFTPIDIHTLNSDLLSKIFINLDIKSIKNITRSSSYIAFHINLDTFFWQFISNSNLLISDCKEIVKKKYLIQKYIKTGKNEKVITILTNQKDITSLSIHQEYIFTSSDDSSVKKFNLSGHLIKYYNAHKGGVWSFSLDKFLVTGSTDKTAIIWDIESGHPLHKLKGHMSTVRVVKCYDNYVCTGGRDSSIRVWNTIGECLFLLIGHTHSVRCMDINKDFLLSGSYDGSVILWDYKKGRILIKLKSHKARVYCVLLGEKYIVSSGLDAYIHISKYSGELISRFKEHTFLVIGLSFTHKERFLVSSAADDALCKWDVEERKVCYILNEKHFLSSHFVKDDLLFVTTQKELKVYDYNTGLYIRTMMEAEKFIKVEMKGNNLVVAYMKDEKYYIRIYKYNL